MTVEIERLTLKLSGMSRHEGELLAGRIREKMAGACCGRGKAVRLDSLRVGVERRQGEPVERLSERIVADLLAQMAQAG